MIDTHPKIAQMMDSLMAQKTGGERILMGLSMLNFAKELIVASLKNANPEIGPKEIKRQLFLRLYGDDFTEKQKEAILKQL